MRPRAWLYCGGRSGWYFGWGDVWGCWWRRCLPCIDKGFCGGGGGEGGGVAVENHYKLIKTTISSNNLYKIDVAYVAVQLGESSWHRTAEFVCKTNMRCERSMEV